MTDVIDLKAERRKRAEAVEREVYRVFFEFFLRQEPLFKFAVTDESHTTAPKK
jgi:hypothetical protein